MEKGQITRHEWKGKGSHRQCPHCLLHRLLVNDLRFIYIKPPYHVYRIEPKCITRKKPADGTDSET